MEREEYILNIDEGRQMEDGSLFSSVKFDDGRTLDLYCDPKNDQVLRYYIKNPEGELVEFGDSERLENISEDDIRIFKHKIAANGIILTDAEVKRVAQAFQERELQRELIHGEDTEH